MDSWSHVASGLSAIIIALLTYLIHKGGKQEDKIDKLMEKASDLVTYEDCRLERQSCPVGNTTQDIRRDRKVSWDKYEEDIKKFKETFYAHSHTSLPSDSVVRLK